MQSMTVEQLRTECNVGGIECVVLKGRGSVFFVQIETRSGVTALLVKARSSEPRRFGNPVVALRLLRDAGITDGRFDASEWNPDEKEGTTVCHGRAEKVSKAYQAATYSSWVASEIYESIEDPRLSTPHDTVIAQTKARIARYKAGEKPKGDL